MIVRRQRGLEHTWSKSDTHSRSMDLTAVLQCRPVIDKSFDKHNDELRRISLEIHDRPELAYQEYKACEVLVEYLQHTGFTVQIGIADTETAFLATFSQGNGPTVSFNAVSL
jgi:metal-dependent amidase/aminoacylase/carboxypeptidase family protein